jgi:hypothetical protein
VPAALLKSAHPLEKLSDVDLVLGAALDQNNYRERSYFAVPEGFAVVTRLERIAADGSPLPEPARWSTNWSQSWVGEFSVVAYLRALFTADPGYYRIIVFVFVVTNVPFTQSVKTVTAGAAAEWLHEGLNKVPSFVGNQRYSPDVACTALIYQFERKLGSSANILVPSPLAAHAHLVRSGLWKALGGGD